VFPDLLETVAMESNLQSPEQLLITLAVAEVLEKGLPQEMAVKGEVGEAPGG
jgi:hypothetical protein